MRVALLSWKSEKLNFEGNDRMSGKLVAQGMEGLKFFNRIKLVLENPESSHGRYLMHNIFKLKRCEFDD